MRRRQTAFLGAVLAVSVVTSVGAAENLLLDEAVELAIQGHDPTVARFEAQQAALQDRAIADSQLPDPQLMVGIMNLPVDSFSFDQEPMTQTQVQLQQMFPAGNTLGLTRAKREAEAAMARAQRDLAERDVILRARLAWLDLYFWGGIQSEIRQSRDAVAELSSVVTASFATGRQSSQDVFRAELELSLLDDRLSEAQRQQAIARAALARYISLNQAARPIPREMPVLPTPISREALLADLTHHPAIEMEDAKVTAGSREIEIAEAQYKPIWMIDAGYGMRRGDSPDLASVGVSVSLPLFPGRRQDRRVSAARHDRQAARLERQTKLLEFGESLESLYAAWTGLGDRIALYQQAVRQRAADTTEASLSAYRNGVADFNDLIQARLAELEADITLLRLTVDRAKAQSQLLYFEGDANE